MMLSTPAPLEIRSLDEGTERAWDAFVEARPDGSQFHLSGWKRVIESAFGHRCEYLCATRSGRITGVLPLVHVRSRLFSNALISTAFCVYGGPLAEDSASLAALDDAALELGRSLGVDYVEYRLRKRAHDDWVCNDSLYATFRKEILPEPEANLLAIPRKQRAMIRKGAKQGLRCADDQGVDRFFRLYSESVRNLGTPVYPRRFFDLLKAEFAEACEITVVEKDGSALSAVMSFLFRDEVLPYYGGGCADARNNAAYDFMYWNVMARASERGVKTFDFGRSKLGTGSYDFKRHWGFDPIPLCYEYCLLAADGVPEINPLNPKYRLAISVWKQLPLSAANLIGPYLSRSLG